MASTYVDPGPSWHHGFISMSGPTLQTRDVSSLQNDIDRVLEATEPDVYAEMNIFPSRSGPITTLAEIMAALEDKARSVRGGEETEDHWVSKYSEKDMHMFLHTDTDYSYYQPLRDAKPARFEFGVAYPPQEALVDRSNGYTHDLVYDETVGLPNVYVQEDLSDTDKDASSHNDDDDDDDDNSTIIERIDRKATTKGHEEDENGASESHIDDGYNTTEEQDNQMHEMDLAHVKNPPSGTEQVDDSHPSVRLGFIPSVDLLEMLSSQWRAEARKTLFNDKPELCTFGQVKTSDMHELKLENLLNLLTTSIESTKRCTVCQTVNFNLIPTEEAKAAGDASCPVKRPSILSNNYGEVAPLLPSFNRMVLNCEDGACSQCCMIVKTLIVAIGTGILHENGTFDREAMIQCHLSCPLGTVKQYVDLLTEEAQSSSPRPIPAPVLQIRPPTKAGLSARDSMEDISLLIANICLPFQDMQGSAQLVDRNGVELEKVKGWWESCQQEHGPNCQTSSSQLYAGSIESGYPLRLIDVTRNRVVVAPAGCRYIALSYVWPKTNNPFKAQERDFRHPENSTGEQPTRDDDAVYLDIPLDRLPKTIQDALHITRAIGEQYLWIDALCIIQDDPIDLNRAVHKMDKIYGAASLTIVMGDRDGAVLEGGSRTRHQLWTLVDNVIYVIPQPSIQDALPMSVWESRGWTYQEWHFSKRKLVFVGGRAYYTCARTLCQEDRLNGPFRMEFDHTPHDIFFTNENDYCRHVETYSARELTNGADVLNAFQGLMNEMGQQLRTDFCWGIPIEHFDGALLWNGVKALTRRRDQVVTGPDIRSSFPSWSWAGWHGAVKFRPKYHSDNRSLRTQYDAAVNRLGHITRLVTWPWQDDFQCPPDGPDRRTIIFDVIHRGLLRFVTSVAQINVKRLRRLFARQGIHGWTLDDGEFVSEGFKTCIVLSEVENPQIGSEQARIGEITGRSPIMTYNVMVVEDEGDGVFRRVGLVKITRWIWEACNPEIRWITLV